VGDEVGIPYNLISSRRGAIPGGKLTVGDAWSEIDEIGAIINSDRGRGAGSVRIGYWRAGPEKCDLRLRGAFLWCFWLRFLSPSKSEEKTIMSA
jgi:hypothetical protein